LASIGIAQDQREDWKEYLPPGAAKQLVATRCTVCHELNTFVPLRQSEAAWRNIVNEMMNLGASLLPEEEEQIVSYLGTVFSPEAPRLTDVNRAAQDDLVKLPGITPELADRIVAYRTNKGPFSSRDEVKTTTGLSDETFEKIRWYVRPAGPPDTSRP
jgi:competence ComEA-like helix-hairpin-helix protein